MDAGQDHFPDSAGRQGPDLPADLLRAAGPDPAPGKGNDAVGAELVAAVLDLDIGPGVTGGGQLHVLIFRPLRQVRHGPAAQGLVRNGVKNRVQNGVQNRVQNEVRNLGLRVRFEKGVCLCLSIRSRTALFSGPEEILQQFGDLSLAVVADGQVNGRVCPDPVPVRLHVAADGDHDRAGTALFGPVQHLPALAVGNIGNSTGVDHVYVRLPVKRDRLIALFFQQFFHDIQLVAVNFAAEIVVSSSFQIFFSG